jgi:2-phospho-L-lactate guanylyltransferase
MTVIPSDVPLAFAGDLQDVLDTGSTSEIVVVPSGRGGGTNALYLRPPDLIEPQFGKSSLRAHIRLAERRGHRCSILSLPRLALDIDTADDVEAFMARPKFAASHTADVLENLRAAAND